MSNDKLAEAILSALISAAGAKTNDEKARIAWRFNDAMWRRVGDFGVGFPRAFNNLLQDQKWPWVKKLWMADEASADWDSVGLPGDLMVGRNPHTDEVEG